jgi:hypothetical protein
VDPGRKHQPGSWAGASSPDVAEDPILQEISQISIRHDVPLPASLTLIGKALAQVQLVTAELDPALDPFAVAGHFLMRKFRGEVKGRLDPQKLFYESQKLRMRTVRFVESVEQLTGARPGPRLQVNIRGTERLEDNIRRAGRRLSLALAAGGVWIGTVFAAASAHAAGWVPPSLAGPGHPHSRAWDRSAPPPRPAFPPGANSLFPAGCSGSRAVPRIALSTRRSMMNAIMLITVARTARSNVSAHDDAESRRKRP